MRGEIVVVRAYRGKALVRRVWGADNQLVFLVEDSHFKSLIEGQESAVGLIGFPKEDVFKYDLKMAKEINDPSSREHFSWDKLEPWTT